MYSVEVDPAKRLLVITALGYVAAAEVADVRRQIESILRDAIPGFAVLTDFRFMESMKPETARHIGEIMDLLAQKQVVRVVRVIPEPSKDIGMNILSHLHYGSRVEVVTVSTLAEAIMILAES